MLRLLGGGFQSNHSSRTDFWAWPAPQFSVWTKRELSKHLYAHIRMGVEYDGSEFYVQDRDSITLKQIHYTSLAPWSYVGSAGIGMLF